MITELTNLLSWCLAADIDRMGRQLLDAGLLGSGWRIGYTLTNGDRTVSYEVFPVAPE